MSAAETLARGHPALSEREFDQICVLLRERAGIHLSHAKRRLVVTRLAPRLRTTRSGSFGDYLALVADEGSEESEHFLNALTTNVTGFFREPHHFEILRQRVLPAVQASPAKAGRLRFWCAACSTGEEPYSLAITLLESGLDPEQRDVRILATDIDSRVLAHAAEIAPRLVAPAPQHLVLLARLLLVLRELALDPERGQHARFVAAVLPLRA